MTRLEARSTEAQLKAQIEDYLQYGMNQGRWWFTRLNAGSFIADKGTPKERLIKGCPKGTADLEVIVGSKWEKARLPKVYFLELKSPTGRQTKEQKEFQESVRRQGCFYYLIRSIEEVMLLLYPNEPL